MKVTNISDLPTGQIDVDYLYRAYTKRAAKAFVEV